MTAPLAYRRGVGAVLLNDEGLVWVGRRTDVPGGAWQPPQGGIKTKEEPEAAVLRELKEEIGTDRAVVIARASAWLSYDLPPHVAAKRWKGRYRGQTQCWFALRFTGRESDIDVASAKHAEFNAWRWVTIEELPGLAVAFKRPVYERVVAEFRPLAVPSPPEPSAP
ncbi:RNA pyrophosphohydrolase [Candidatus Defluviicoccus seviourii]|uniref:RNA pyrophosphohydrolase n=1 Tax=Candidatus Defluviicoccus seviourii TaxID=2565273 RepID=A0A564WFN7_9PROT|nr:RNA pyrophosphohydrolase [Candidatus Defluviicoccus seviourii]